MAKSTAAPRECHWDRIATLPVAAMERIINIEDLRRAALQ
jgi:hypothetical protein